MDIYQVQPIADIIRGNSYVGRGIVIGKSRDGKKAVFAYFIMGRSENSRNRIFVEKGEEVIIHPYDASRVKDPSLIIYSPVRRIGNDLIVTNGDQTDTIYEFIRNGKTFADALETREFEPDAPNFTPRISGILHFAQGDFTYEMSILKSADKEGTACARYLFRYPALAGVGHFIHTYRCDGNPIPTFTGEPERIVISDDIEQFTASLWEALDENNRISLYVRYIDLADGTIQNRMINKNQ